MISGHRESIAGLRFHKVVGKYFLMNYWRKTNRKANSLVNKNIRVQIYKEWEHSPHFIQLACLEKYGPGI